MPHAAGSLPSPHLSTSPVITPPPWHSPCLNQYAADLPRTVPPPSHHNPTKTSDLTFPFLVSLLQVLRDGSPRARLSPKRASQAMAEALVQAGEGCPVTLVETGPLSCIDEMLKTCDELVRSRIESIVWMGGALDAGGNVVSSGTDCSQVGCCHGLHDVDQVVYGTDA